MTASHLTFTERNLNRGVFFYRMIALVNLCSTGLLIFLFHFALEGVVELWWDRIVSFVISGFVFVWGYSKTVNPKFYIRSVQALFYFQVTILILAAARNDFSAFYFMSLLIIQQSYAYCLRTTREVYYFLGYALGLTVIALCTMSSFSGKDLSLYIFSISLIALMQLLTSVVKSKFMNDLKMNQSMLRTLVSKADMAVFLTDDTGIIMDSNMRATELFEYERGELLGRDFKLLRKNYLSEEEILDAYEELDKNKFWNAVTSLITKSGKEIPVKVSVAPIMNGNRRILIYRVIDITSVKENEATLIEAKEKAEEAVKAKGQFLAMMSHEIRTPLNGVIATASMLTKTRLDIEQSEYVDTIKKSGQNLLMLINDILDFSKMESGKMLLDPQPCKPEEIVYDVADLLRPYAEEKGLTLHVNIKADSHQPLMIDGPKLKQVMLNLLGNALKFTEKGNVTIRCEKIGTLPDCEIIRYMITDTGIGIPEEKLHLLFNSFSQVDSSTSRKYGGTGLGLAISQQIIELMGGTISVESMYGEGTTFSFTLHHSNKIEEALAEQEDEKTEVAHADIDLTKLKVLVADDNEINRQVFKYILGSLDINSEMAMDGSQVIELCNTGNYDVIFMDMQMPKMNGLEATIKIRNDFEHQPLIIAVTANSFKEDRDKCIEAGMDDFLPKPFDQMQVTRLLQKVIAAKKNDIESAA